MGALANATEYVVATDRRGGEWQLKRLAFGQRTLANNRSRRPCDGEVQATLLVKAWLAVPAHHAVDRVDEPLAHRAKLYLDGRKEARARIVRKADELTAKSRASASFATSERELEGVGEWPDLRVRQHGCA